MNKAIHEAALNEIIERYKYFHKQGYIKKAEGPFPNTQLHHHQYAFVDFQNPDMEELKKRAENLQKDGIELFIKNGELGRNGVVYDTRVIPYFPLPNKGLLINTNEIEELIGSSGQQAYVSISVLGEVVNHSTNYSYRPYLFDKLKEIFPGFGFFTLSCYHSEDYTETNEKMDIWGPPRNLLATSRNITIAVLPKEDTGEFPTFCNSPFDHDGYTGGDFRIEVIECYYYREKVIRGDELVTITKYHFNFSGKSTVNDDYIQVANEIILPKVKQNV